MDDSVCGTIPPLAFGLAGLVGALVLLFVGTLRSLK
jgi:hypothetical protein